ncbi:hypothetical protein [Rhodococcus koreensis]|uniref:hypothetical protein n=1 Tax=Rhodococcus koreensis TaxID=99653 RepID=UPI000A74B85E|nr:hypothetical protein [Rhodococcus koreensis]
MPLFTVMVFIAAALLLTETSLLLEATRGFDAALTYPAIARPGLLSESTHAMSMVALSVADFLPRDITTHIYSGGRVIVPALHR